MLNRVYAALVGMVVSLFSSAALAAPVDLAPLTAAVDFSSVITAILAIAVIVMGVHVAIKGVRIVWGMVRG